MSRVFPTSHFGYRKITVERPLRLNFLASPERIARLESEKGFQSLAQSKKRGYAAGQEEAQGLKLQRALRDLLGDLPETIVSDRKAFEAMLDDALKKADLKLPAPARRAVLNALSERDENAAACLDRNDEPEPDPELRDTERVPLAETVDDFFEREVRPHVPDAWIDDVQARPQRRAGGHCWLRDQLQSPLLQVRSAPSAGRHRARHPNHRSRHRSDAGRCHGGRRVDHSALTA